MSNPGEPKEKGKMMAETEEGNPENKRNWLLIVLGGAGGLLVLCILCSLVLVLLPSSDDGEATTAPTEIASRTEITELTDEPTPPPLPTETIPPTQPPAPTDTSAPLDPLEQLEKDLMDVLGSGNRDIPILTKVELNCQEEPSICVTWAINDNLTENMIRTGAQIEATDILRVIAASGMDYQTAFLTGTFSLVDALGNVSEEDVVRLWFSKEIVDQINWDNFLFDNIYVIADDAYVHPLFREQ